MVTMTRSPGRCSPVPCSTAGEAGVRQFLDIGTGLPTADNTHEVAQQPAARESRIVTSTTPPMVLAHAQVLLRPAPKPEAPRVRLH